MVDSLFSLVAFGLNFDISGDLEVLFAIGTGPEWALRLNL
jgi:hypothetical protein